MTTYEAWLLIISKLNLSYDQECFLKGMLYLSFQDFRSGCGVQDKLDNPLIIKIVEFLSSKEEVTNG